VEKRRLAICARLNRMPPKNSSGEAGRRASPYNPLSCLSFACCGIAKLCTFLDTPSKNNRNLCLWKTARRAGKWLRSVRQSTCSVLIATPVVARGSPHCAALSHFVTWSPPLSEAPSVARSRGISALARCYAFGSPPLPRCRRSSAEPVSGQGDNLGRRSNRRDAGRLAFEVPAHD
jgi:hypothetical protein